MAQLHELLARVKSAGSTRQIAVTAAYHLLQRSEPFSGLRRSYTPAEEGGQPFPDENKIVQARVASVIADIMDPWARHLDVQATIDNANTQARANIEIDDQVIVTDVPIAHLLFLEKQIADLIAFISRIPTLDPGEAWTFDKNVDAYVTPPVQTVKTRKETGPVIVVPPTDKFPAQWTDVSKDVRDGTWTTQKLSGAVPPAYKRELMERARALQEAIKAARQRANTVTVTPVAEGAVLLGYLFAPAAAPANS